MKKKSLTRRLITLLLAAVMLFALGVSAYADEVVKIVSGITNVKENTTSTPKYSSAWQYWCQGASGYVGMRDGGGCRVVAYSKLLAEIGYTGFGNPDGFFKWGVDKGYFKSLSNPYEMVSMGTPPVKYVKEQGGGTLKLEGKVSLSKDKTKDCETIMKYLKAGYYVILSTSAHTAYVGRQASLNEGTPVILDSWSSWSQNSASCQTYRKYTHETFANLRYFSYSGTPTTALPADEPAPGGNVTITYPEDSTRIGQIWYTDTDAHVVNTLTKPAGSYVDYVGIVVYDSAWNCLVDSNSWYKGQYTSNSVFYPHFYMQENLGLTLKPGTEYIYRIYAKIDGVKYVSEYQRFWTTGGKSTLTINFNSNGGTVTADGFSQTSDGTIYKGSNKVATVWKQGTGSPDYGLWNAGSFGLTKSGYTFLGWCADKNGSGMIFDEDDKSLVADDIYPNIKNGNATVTLYAAWQRNIPHFCFPCVDVYGQGQFTDVPANQWYTGNVAAAFEFGLMKGNSATTFNPYGDVTIAEAITMAARIYSIYTEDEYVFDQTKGGAWYQCYLDYAYNNGIIAYKYYNCNVSQRATRAQFAEIFACAIPDDYGYYPMNSVADYAIPDVGMGKSYASYVYKLYRAGILTGSDVNGTFNPDTFITRAEAAAIVSRIANTDNRVSFSL